MRTATKVFAIPNIPSATLACSRSPELVERGDIMEFALDGTVADDGRAFYLERFDHGAIYEARPDIHAVVHAHAEDVLPFTITATPLRPVIHSGSVYGSPCPAWDIADNFVGSYQLPGNEYAAGSRFGAMSCSNCTMGPRSSCRRNVTHRGRQNVRIRAAANARVLMAAMRLGGEVKNLSQGEIAARAAVTNPTGGNGRAWGNIGRTVRMRPFARGTSDRDDQDVEPDLKPRRFGAPLIGAVAGRRVSTSRGALKGSSGPYLYPSALWAHMKPRL